MQIVSSSCSCPHGTVEAIEVMPAAVSQASVPHRFLLACAMNAGAEKEKRKRVLMYLLHVLLAKWRVRTVTEAAA
jgi:hypothetical protein